MPSPGSGSRCDGLSDGRRTGGRDVDRGVSETTGVAVLVAFTVVVTAAVGVGVLFFEDDGDTVQANFSYSYLSDTSQLLITMDRGGEIPAGNILVSGPANNVTWAMLAGYERNRTIVPGDAVQASGGNSYGSDVQVTDTFVILYAPGDGNRTVLSRWNP